jgi:hypothetical protein
VSASSGQSEKNMIVTDEQGTSEVHRDGFEISACQVLVWDSRSAVEASQLKRHIPIIVVFSLCTFENSHNIHCSTGGCASSFFGLINA